jgi:IS605 OrfB family transposase
MLLTLKAKLYPTIEQKKMLVDTMEQFNNACNSISKIAFELRCYNKYKIQQKCYYDIRKEFNLPAQLAIRAISKVVESYKVDKTCIHVFDKYGAIVYDQRVLSFKGLDKASITTTEGRVIVPMIYGSYVKLDESRIKGQADLIYIKGDLYLCIVVDVPEEIPLTPEGVLGVDMGVVNIATTSDGVIYSSDKCNGVRERFSKLKSTLQSVGTKSAKRHLKNISGKERRFKTNTNHIIAKQIVQVAKDTNRAIAVEELTHIRSRTTVKKAQREQFGKWAFSQLRLFLEYKSKLIGVPFVSVDPRNTSRECSVCGYIDKNNRTSQAEFKCRECGHTEHADYNAAKNIAARALVNVPIAVCSKEKLNRKPTTLVVGY